MKNSQKFTCHDLFSCNCNQNSNFTIRKKKYRVRKKYWPPCHTKFDLFSIVLGKSDETMPYRLDLGNSFGVVYIAVTYLVQELC